MKKKLVIAGLLGFTLLFGCSQTYQEVEADKEKEFTVISSESSGLYKTIITLKHNKTGCYYLVVTRSDGGIGITPMLDKDGLPYCE